MALVWQLEVSWSVVCAACCHMALIFVGVHKIYIYIIVHTTEVLWSMFVNFETVLDLIQFGGRRSNGKL